MNNELKGVWVASAEVETVQGDLDRAEMALREAIVEAMIAGEPMDGICSAANLTRAELTRRVRAQGIPARPGLRGRGSRWKTEMLRSAFNFCAGPRVASRA